MLVLKTWAIATAAKNTNSLARLAFDRLLFPCMCCCSNLAALSTVPQEKKVNFPSYIDNHDQTMTITCYTYTFAHCHQSSIISMLTHKLTCSVNGLCWKVLSGHFQQMGFPYLYSQSILSPALDDSLRFFAL